MSLLKRVEQAQQAAAEAAAAAAGDRPATNEDPAYPAATTTTAASATAGAATAATATAVNGAAATTATTVEIVPLRAPAPAGRPGARDEYLQDIRQRLIIEATGATGSLFEPGATDVPTRVEGIVDRFIRSDGVALTGDERRRLVEGLIGEVIGFGPLEPYLQDPTITEVMVNGPNQIYIERKGKIERVPATFLNDEHVMRIIDRIIAPLGRRIDQSSPRVDARLPDGSRVNAIIPPLSLIGPVITIRRFSATPYTVQDLIGFGTATAEMFDFIQACVEARLNLFVSGGTGSGKTTTLNVISSFIPNDERIVTIEDAAELQLDQEHVVTLESRPPNLEGRGEITIRDLLRNALHMRPDRIIVGECRSGEALDMLQAMTVGHEGSMSTGHANSPRDMLSRLETMVLMAGVELPLRAIREQVASAVDLIVHTARLKDGTRKIVTITEVYGMEEDTILTQDIFVFQQTGVVDGKIQGVLRPTGIRPTFMPKFKARGVELPAGEFGIPPEDPNNPDVSRSRKGRTGGNEELSLLDSLRTTAGLGRAARAGGMLYVSGIGPVDPEAGRLVSGGIREQTRQCMQNLKNRLEAEGTSLEKVVWANWSLRDASEFDTFNEEWVRWFPSDAPVGQGTLMTAQQRRAGFRISLGVIAEA
jgi:pilus assembly protein CpaF